MKPFKAMFIKKTRTNRGMIKSPLKIVTNLLGLRTTKRHKRNIKIAAKNEVNSIEITFE